MKITELSLNLWGISEGFLQLYAVHPRFNEFFSVMYHVAFRGFGEAFVEWPLRCG